jgi:hypothetical protein
VKTVLAVLLTFACTVTSAYAQTPAPQFGVKLGPTISNLSVDPDDPEADIGSRWGLGGGGFAVWPLNPLFSVQIEGLFTPKGNEFTPPAGSEFGATTGRIALDYLEFPVLARIDVSRSVRSSFHLFAGPSMGFNTRARSELELDGELFDNGVSDDIGDQVNAFDLGLVVGAGIEIGRYVIVDGRYSWGLLNVSDVDDDDTVIKNRALTILAGVRFGRR